ncbi:MAG: PD40 domain-containing protein [Clostridia bacterium]|nr:PD40 domain-containing protein [Clostridia bacterium]
MEGAKFLNPPVLLAPPNQRRFRSGDQAHVPYFDNHGYSVLARFDTEIDPASADGRVVVEPASALLESVWETLKPDTDSPATQLRLRIRPQPPGGQVRVVLRAGIRSVDGRVLGEDQHLEVRFEEATRVRITLTARSYLPGEEARGFTAPGRPSDPLPILMPGAASLELSFTRAVDRRTVESALRVDLLGRMIVDEPVWDASGRSVAVRLNLEPAEDEAVTLALTDTHHAAPPEPVVDQLGMPIADDSATMTWLVGEARRVRRARLDPANGEDAGTVPRLPGIRAAGAAALRADRLLTWHTTSTEPECGGVSLTLWDLPQGRGLPLGPSVGGCFPQAAWSPDGNAVYLVGHAGLYRFQVPADQPLSALAEAPEAVVYRAAERRFIDGFALAPDGRLALFEARFEEKAARGSGSVDLVVLDAEGREMARVEDVSDLVSSESIWTPVEAAWAPDGTRLAYVALRASEERNEAGYPASIERRLALWNAATGEVSVTPVRARQLSWRPGTAQVLVLGEDGWELYDTITGGRERAPLDGSDPVGWSPDGRYLLFSRRGLMGGSEYGIADFQTGRLTQVYGWQPLGWNQDDGKAYWLED